jgi:hypothetical protein
MPASLHPRGIGVLEILEPFTSRYDCEAQIIKTIKASNITDHRVMDDYQCFEDKQGS